MQNNKNHLNIREAAVVVVASENTHTLVLQLQQLHTCELLIKRIT